MSENGKVLSITALTPEQVDILRNISSQFETVLWQPASPIHITANTEVHLYVPEESVLDVTAQLESNQFTHRVMLEDTEQLIEIQTKNDTKDPRLKATSFYERYHNLEEIYHWVNKTATDHANMVKVLLIGSSFEKRPLYVLKLSGRASNTPKKAMWIDCGIHAGVDLNRNFDANWCTSGASSNPCDDTYCGQYPESEPEAQAVANFLRSHKATVKLYVSIHSYSQMLLFPYSCAHELAANHDELNEMAQDAANDIQRYYRSHYKIGPGSKTIYLAPGGSDDWAYNLGINYSFTFELQDRGRYGFLLPPNLIANACKEALLALKSISLKVIKRIQ
ncbi:carboxypeptidase B2 [Alosa pseudoharengus]|uniref:carboxypeptidase B2 n=1 Tax=Alosa pseudoharengus TaxID=34774 RepID=UPI003F888CB3